VITVEIPPLTKEWVTVDSVAMRFERWEPPVWFDTIFAYAGGPITISRPLTLDASQSETVAVSLRATSSFPVWVRAGQGGCLSPITTPFEIRCALQVFGAKSETQVAQGNKPPELEFVLEPVYVGFLGHFENFQVSSGTAGVALSSVSVRVRTDSVSLDPTYSYMPPIPAKQASALPWLLDVVLNQNPTGAVLTGGARQAGEFGYGTDPAGYSFGPGLGEVSFHFRTLVIDRPGTGYTLRITGIPGYPPIESPPFNVSVPP
jgi:hypothetical protein